MSKNFIAIFFDTIVVVVGFFCAYFIRNHYTAVPLQPIHFYSTFLVFSVVLFCFMTYFYGVYNSRSPLSFGALIDFLKVYGAWGVGVCVLAFFSKADYSRLLMGIFLLMSGIFLILIRVFLYPVLFPISVVKDASLIKETILTTIRFGDQLAFLEGTHRDRTLTAFYVYSKRCTDVVGACLGLFVTFMLAPFIVYTIRRDTPGPILITQNRVGLHGKVFRLYKFRTMHQHTTLYARAPHDENDSRVTTVGRVLRKYSLDELPQFWNVLKGDMSLVGPRPEMPFIVAQYSDVQRIRLLVKPGITGMWQILGRKDMPLEQNIEYDIYYVSHQSLLLDMAVLIRTIPHLIFPKGAY